MAQSFPEYFTCSEASRCPSSFSVQPAESLGKVRKAKNETLLIFARNFSKDKQEKVSFVLNFGGGEKLILSATLPYKDSFVALNNYQILDGSFHLILNTAPIHARLNIQDELWIVENSNSNNGELLFLGELSVECSDDVIVDRLRLRSDAYTRIQFKTHGKGSICMSNSSNERKLFILYLERDDLYTLTGNDKILAWGASQIFVDTSSIDVKYTSDDSELFCISKERPRSFMPLSDSAGGSCFKAIPFVWSRGLDRTEFIFSPPLIKNVKSAKQSLDDMPWTEIDQIKGSNHFKATEFPVDFGFTSLHSLYKFEFDALGGNKIRLALAARHRATIYLNGKAISGSMTYSLQLFMPGNLPSLFHNYRCKSWAGS